MSCASRVDKTPVELKVVQVSRLVCFLLSAQGTPVMAEVLPMSICIPSCLILKQELGGSLVVMGDVIITVNTWMAGLRIFQADGPTRESKKLDLWYHPWETITADK